ncbi:hydroxypyruvate isomerase family protein [Paracoccus albus]|uniref:hydroxypyruvate isomerase family protein n=1 Tax=Paracoccus albus TaxID=3017784 RepID=UPI0022F0EC24|nr:TIM barrel protein [Paracoccus albus]WBU61278.1 TIM barrel protein [Paracoccus albus]
MARFAANLTLLFNELPMLQRFDAARQAGFQGAEILFPYDLPARDLRRAARTAGLDVVLINCPPPNWAGGPRGFAALPEAQDRFRLDFERTLRVAQALSARHIHIMAGKAEGPEAHDCFVDNLRWAAGRAPHVSLTIEPMNATDVPGYFLNSFDLALQVIEAVGASNVGLQFDAHQAYMITGDVIGTFQRCQRRVHHIQIAGAPDRNEPRENEIDYSRFMEEVERSGYSGWVSAEYTPRKSTEGGLRWLHRGLQARRRFSRSR